MPPLGGGMEIFMKTRFRIIGIILVVVICLNSKLGVFAAEQAVCSRCGHSVESRGYSEHWTEPCQVHAGCVIHITVKNYYYYCPSCYYSELVDTKVEYCHLVRGASSDESHEEIYCSE